MEKIKWNTKKGDETLSGEFEYNIPETLAEMIEVFGDDNVRLAAKKSIVIYLQAWARREATKEENPLTAEEIAEKAPKIKVSFGEREYVDPIEKHIAALEKLTPAQKARLRAALETNN